MDDRIQIEAARVEGAGETDMQGLQDLLNETRSGSFVVVRGYVSKESEKQATDEGTGDIDASRLESCDYWLQHGIDYGRIKTASEAVLLSLLAGTSAPLKVSHGIWIDPAALRGILAAGSTEGIRVKFRYRNEGLDVEAEATVPEAAMEAAFGNRSGKGRIQASVSYAVPCSSPLLRNAAEAALEGIRNPKQVDQGYDRFAKGGYVKDDKGRLTLYLRDCLRVHRVVRSEGKWDFKASAPKSAIRDAVERLTPKGRYRCMTFEPMANGKPRFQSISIGGVSLLVDGITEEMYFAPAEAVKEAVAAQA